jgi:hypothetical protein
MNGKVTGYGVDGAASGAGISNQGVLLITDCVVRNNSVVHYSVTSPGGGVGGGIASFGTLTVVRTTVTDNVVGGLGGFDVTAAGGGVYADSLTLIDSTVSHNRAVATPGIAPLLVASIGGGVYARNAVITNSTITSNESDTGALVGHSLTIANATISHNRDAGLSFAPYATQRNATVRNTIIANNDRDCALTIAPGAHNLDSDGSCGLGAGDLPQTDPLLGPLENNGGPTWTRALTLGSPAIDAGNSAPPGSGDDACETYDQRGAARPQGEGCDIGAFEVGTIAPSPTPTTVVTPSPSATVPAPECSGDCDVNSVVDVDELVIAIRIALDQAGIDGCSSLDQTRDDRITVEELIAAINHLLRGCPGR